MLIRCNHQKQNVLLTGWNRVISNTLLQYNSVLVSNLWGHILNLIKLFLHLSDSLSIVSLIKLLGYSHYLLDPATKWWTMQTNIFENFWKVIVKVICSTSIKEHKNIPNNRFLLITVEVLQSFIFQIPNSMRHLVSLSDSLYFCRPPEMAWQSISVPLTSTWKS